MYLTAERKATLRSNQRNSSDAVSSFDGDVDYLSRIHASFR